MKTRTYAYIVTNPLRVLCADCRSDYRGFTQRASISTIVRDIGTSCCDNCSGDLSTGQGAVPS